jgi:outer membrane protein, adhesin transport system
MDKGWVAGIPARGCAALGFLLSVVATDGGALARSLEETVQITLDTNPQVGVVQADREAVEQELRQARALRFPSLDVRGAIGPEYTNSPATRNRATRPPGEAASTTLLRQESQLTLTQMLFDGYGTGAEIDRQFARVDSAARRVREAAEFVALDGVEYPSEERRRLLGKAYAP